ncbi:MULTISPECIES: type II toxin-antitoxin system HicA family toxin [Pasteurellaceae]|uniref:Type II toxin-antitoxin system HicA family toxin n=1 Tax=Pasteurella atlantica TaxID=2827233 RepID=A0AAW8CPA2_9PAST|nr:type II toxin-antitoxin system HicA family toxin [Pasteurella atlantica]MBR0574207.1 type II toxin-antitoxin system HicA family toxin [Pasteurella atlantica]MDP8039316.1 type II toxin-antitoxin system HicA family toxin [Pasteurella atlantica]MDP8041408.1 type II toxin-antitoxin system HicA family toxin [Pasteurella atlantica]MDP8043544.1 type II toxin-antitoxin system HicA family toxin [Pasteurella atlantica]MDP8045538.1 type II toxin-antitoxin system HicA family toxin [Pasteurella atlantic
MHSRDLIKDLKKQGCYFIRHGKGDHQVWYSPKTGKKFVVPHPKKEVAIGTLRSIQKSAGLL